MKFLNQLFSDQFTLPDFLSQKYIPSLDGFRALSILFVIIAHLNFNPGLKLIPNVVSGGQLGVHFFFVISGLLITTLLLKEKTKKDRIDLKGFYIRRAFRILPVAYGFILVLMGLNYYFSLNIKPSFFVYQFTFTENFNKDLVWQTKHYWSLSVEEQFYLLFPFVLNKSYKSYVVMLIALLIATPVTVLALHGYQQHQQTAPLLLQYLYNFLTMGLCSIVIGSLTAILLCKYPVNLKVNTNIVFVVQIGLFYLIWLFYSHPFFGSINIIIAAVLIAVLIASTIYFTDNLLYKFLNLAFIKKIGVLSYSLYIWQQLFVANQPWKSFYGQSTLFLPLNILALICVAYASYTYFETPFLMLKNRFKSS